MAADERDDDELTLGGVSAQARALARLRPLPPAVVARLGGVLRADELDLHVECDRRQHVDAQGR